MNPIMSRLSLTLAVAALLPTAASAASFNRDSLAMPDSAKVTVSPKDYPGLQNPNPRGWYYKCANVVVAKNGDLVACWQQSDNHTSLTSYIGVVRSTDGGKTWGDYQAIDHANVWVEQAVWVVPQMGVLRDGRILIVCDRGHRSPRNDMPMLSTWQTKERGMWNYIWWS